MRVEVVTQLKRHATDILADLHLNKEPILITEHGKPSAYLLDVDDYEHLQSRMSLLEGIARGERDLSQGKTLTHEAAKERFSQWLN